jgi:hypothetical protein
MDRWPLGLYANCCVDPFANLPAALQNNKADMLYGTDRSMEQGEPPQWPRYATRRSRSMVMGIGQVQFGTDVSWDQLVQASRSRERSVDMTVSVIATTELGRSPPTSRALVRFFDRDDVEEPSERMVRDPCGGARRR